MDNAEELNDDYIKWIMDTIAHYKKYADILTRSEVELDPPTIQKLLAQHQKIRFSLLAEKHRRLRLWTVAKRNFNSWWNSCLFEAKKSLTTPTGKFPAVKDYTVKGQEDNKEEYNKRLEELEDFESKYNFLEELKKDWEAFHFNLNALNDNMKSELKSLCFDNYKYDDAPKTRKPRG
jgi:hypothetical protein